jgi:hypothetical protein
MRYSISFGEVDHTLNSVDTAAYRSIYGWCRYPESC